MMPYNEFLDKQSQAPSKKGDSYKYFITEEPLPESLFDDVYEPNVTFQILDLQEATFSQGKNYKTLAHYKEQDQLVCIVVGQTNITLLSPWERLYTFTGFGMSPPRISPVNFTNPNFQQF